MTLILIIKNKLIRNNYFILNKLKNKNKNLKFLLKDKTSIFKNSLPIKKIKKILIYLIENKLNKKLFKIKIKLYFLLFIKIIYIIFIGKTTSIKYNKLKTRIRIKNERT